MEKETREMDEGTGSTVAARYVEITCARCGWRVTGAAKIALSWERLVVSVEHWCPQHIITTPAPREKEREG